MYKQHNNKWQQKLGHMLPLGAYLLKPVQRVLWHSLIPEKINGCLSTGEDGKEDIMEWCTSVILMKDFSFGNIVQVTPAFGSSLYIFWMNTTGCTKKTTKELISIPNFTYNGTISHTRFLPKQCLCS
ncbi:uncharacterized protein [Dysidea avara]|uniref:uncharacterized protein n=1 Tax=Dysidea avara TaxID=196820 RepID=UPI00332C1B07